MRVLHVFTVPVTRNGITMFALQRLPGLRAAGAAVGFVAPGEVEPSLRAEIEAAGARLYVLPQKRPGLGYVRAQAGQALQGEHGDAVARHRHGEYVQNAHQSFASSAVTVVSYLPVFCAS